MMPRLQVMNLSKAYRQWSSEWLRLASWLGFPSTPLSEHVAVRDVTFSVAPGECVGIVGQNGAGKSTLLKLIVGTSRPTGGYVFRIGSVAAILELGMGFNPELTGRQNVLHVAALMGRTQEEVLVAMPEVEAFAEIGEYFDVPVRTYSSGMQMRVAFSVATAFRPDILIVDEALSVGDAYFVHKCFDRIRSFKQEGTSLLFVSHDLGAVMALCDRAILLESGELILDGEPKQVIDYYNALIAAKERGAISTRVRSDGAVATESGTGEVAVVSVKLLVDSTPVEYVEVGQEVVLQVAARVQSDVERLVFGYMIRDRLGQPVFGTNTHYTEQELADVSRGTGLVFDVRFVANLGPGSYSVSVALTGGPDHLVGNFEWKDMALVFNVVNVAHDYFIGSNWLPPVVEISRSPALART